MPLPTGGHLSLCFKVTIKLLKLYASFQNLSRMDMNVWSDGHFVFSNLGWDFKKFMSCFDTGKFYSLL